MPDPLTIAVFGASLISRHQNPRVDTVRGLLRALHARGHGITFYEPLAFDRQQHRDIDDPGYARSVVYHASLNSVRDVLDKARGANLVLKAGEAGVFDSFLDEEILELQERGAAVLYWDLTPVETLESLRQDPSDLFAALVPEYDSLVLPGDHPDLRAPYEALGARTCLPLLPAVDPDEVLESTPDDRFTADLAFLGDSRPGRDERLRAWFFDVAAANANLRFLLGGEGWGAAAPELPNLRNVGPVDPADRVPFHTTPTAVLALRRDDPAALPVPPEDLFAAAAAGACLLCDASHDLAARLTPDESVLLANQPEEIVTRLATLSHDQARTIGQAARETVFAGHTFAHRAGQLETAVRRILDQRR